MQEPVVIDNLRVEFPYVPYECQRSFMSKVVAALNSSENAALESPTGTGKTLSLLCASIAWLQNEKRRAKPQIGGALIDASASAKISEGSGGVSLYPKIYYASRTHSQLKQVVRELNKTRYKSLIKVATLAGREHLCVNERVISETNSEVKGHLCRTLVKNRKCHYYNKLEKDSDLADGMYDNESDGNILDIEDLVNVAKKLRHCPFYRTREMDKSAELILLPYNYVLDPKTRESYDVKLRGNILIFDEAHNLESIAEESVSVSFTTKTLAMSIQECKRVLELILEEEENIRIENDNSTISFSSLLGNSKKEKNNDNFIPKKNDVSILLSQLHSLSDKIAATDFEKEGKKLMNQNTIKGVVFNGVYLMRMLENCGFTKSNKIDVCLLIDRMGVFLANSVEKSGILEERSANLGEFASFLSKVFVDTFEGVEQIEYVGKFQKVVKFTLDTKRTDASKFFQLFVVVKGERITLNYWCFAAGVAMKFLQSRGVRSIILTSGTLSPIPQFISTMTIPFEHVLENTHAAHSNQLIVGALTKGRGGADIRGNYKRSREVSYKVAIGDLLLQTVRVTPQGVLAFFPSYSKLNDCVNCWKDTKSAVEDVILWTLLERHKKIFIEPTDKTVAAEFCGFDAAVRGQDLSGQQNGGLFLAVCRGKLSEGIDFADSHSRAVFIVGLPLPPLYNEKIMLKREFLAERLKKDPTIMKPDEWYELEGCRAVNQALGRVIRHKDDFGAVILADSRYADKTRRQNFPFWMRDSVRVYESPNTFFDHVQRFFKERGLLVERSRHRLRNETLVEVDEIGSRKRKHLQWADEVEERRNCDMVAGILDAYGDAIQQFRALPSTSTATTQNDGEQKVLNNIIDLVSNIPDSEKRFQRDLKLCDNAQKYTKITLEKCHVVEKPPAAKRFIKLKANVKINREGAVANKILNFQRNRQAASDVGAGSQTMAMSEHESNNQSVKAVTDDLPTFAKPLLPKISLLNGKQNTDLPIAKNSTMPGSSVPNSDAASMSSGIRPILKNSPLSGTKTSSKISVSKTPSVLTIDEYGLLINALEPIKKIRLLKAQRAYLQSKNFDGLVESLEAIALPDDPQIYTGFYAFLFEEHKKLHADICRSLQLL